jgi:hypothetical protein
VRLLDLVLRQGHLSERVLVDAVLTGRRPEHLDRCDLCAERADAVGRWLDDVRQAGVDATDAVFPPEVLTAQQAQILRRLRQLDEPSRVIEFPSQPRSDFLDGMPRGVAPRWVGIAAAAGLAIGLVGGQAVARLGPAGPEPASQSVQPAAPTAPAFNLTPESLIELNLNSGVVTLGAIDEMTPELVSAAVVGG